MKKEKWIKASIRKPEHLVSVLVFIPEEDEHITTGMWDITNKWVLLDEYRVPKSEVTYWMEMVTPPDDKSYTPTPDIHHEETTTDIIRNLQRRVYDLEQANNHREPFGLI